MQIQIRGIFAEGYKGKKAVIELTVEKTLRTEMSIKRPSFHQSRLCVFHFIARINVKTN